MLLDAAADAKAEDVGRQAAEELLRNLDHGGCVDDYLQDQVETPLSQSLLITPNPTSFKLSTVYENPWYVAHVCGSQ